MKARKLGIPFDGNPGKLNAITDVEGVLVSHSTIIEGEGELIVGKGPKRTGVTSIFPCGINLDNVFAGHFSYNGNGEMTGTAWIDEVGLLQGPVCITNTHSVGLVRDAIIEWARDKGLIGKKQPWMLPVVAETYDGLLNDINGFHVKRKHVFDALNSAKSGNILEGCVGGGTGMICHQFKAGIGTSSRVIFEKEGGYTIGALVQTNYGLREHLTISGVPVGKELKNKFKPKLFKQKEDINAEQENGSIIVIIATDAPLLPFQLKRIAKRVPAGLARVGGYGGHTSGDIFLAFSTANKNMRESNVNSKTLNLESLKDQNISPLFKATAEVTEEAIINALINAETMKGINGNTVYALPHDELQTIMKKYNRLH